MSDPHETAALNNQHSVMRTARVLVGTALVLALSVVTLQKTELRAKAAPGASVKEKLVGSWKLVSRVSRLDNGEIVPDPALGEKPSGVLIYDASGHVAAQLSRQGRTMDIFRASQERAGTANEWWQSGSNRVSALRPQVVSLPVPRAILYELKELTK